jgi:hypothetical protein
MHEVAHIICEHPPMKISMVAGLPVREYSEVHEEEAEWLGSCLQLPRVPLIAALRRGHSESQIMEQFRLSAPMLRYRRNKTGVNVQLARIAASRFGSQNQRY